MRCGVVFGLLLGLLASPALAQVAQVQHYLNAIGLEAGPEDGAAGPNTVKAWHEFLQHRGLPLNTPMDAAAVAEFKGQSKVTFPKAKGMKFSINAGRFPSKDTYVLSPDDPGEFSITMRPGDYDTVDYRESASDQERQHAWSLFKQRGQIVSQLLKTGQTYTIDFDVDVDNVGGGTFFELWAGHTGDQFMFQAFPGAIRVNANVELENTAVYSGDWYGKWHRVRMVFMPAKDGTSWFRIYVDGQKTLDTTGRNLHFPILEPKLLFGIYRGASRGLTTTASYRNISLSTGDLGDQPAN